MSKQELEQNKQSQKDKEELESIGVTIVNLNRFILPIVVVFGILCAMKYAISIFAH